MTFQTGVQGGFLRDSNFALVIAGQTTISVMAYGAKGDGVTDDTTAIQNAVNAANALGGGTVTLPRGVFMISASIKMYDSVHLIGAGAEFKDTTKGTVIKSTGVGVLVGLPMVDVNDTKWARVERITFVGPTTDATANTTGGINDFADTSKQATFLIIRDVAFRYLGRSCIGLYGNVNWIQNFRADECAWHKIHLKNSTVLGTGSDNHIEGVDTGYCSGNGTSPGASGDGLFIEGGSNNECIGGRFYNQRYGIHILGSGGGNRFTVPRCEKNDRAGIFLDTTTKNEFDGFDCFNNGLVSGFIGVQLSASPRNRLSGSVKNDQFAASPGVQTFTANTDGTTTITNISNTANLRADQKIVGTDIPASTYIVSVNTGASTAVISNAASGTHTGVTMAPLPTDKGVVLQGASDHNHIDVDVDNVNVHAVQIDESAYNEVALTCYDIGQSAYVVGGASGTKDWNRLVRLNARDCGQRVTATYDVIQVNAGANNYLGMLQYVAVSTKKAHNFINIPGSGATGVYINNVRLASSYVSNSTLSDTSGVANIRDFLGFTNSGPVVAVPATTVAITTASTHRYFYITAAAGGSVSIAHSAGPTVVIPASQCVMVFVPQGQNFTPTYGGGNAPTWVVHAVGN